MAMKKLLKYKSALMFKKSVGPQGIDRKKLDALRSKTKKAHQKSHKKIESDEHSFISALYDQKMSRDISSYAAKIKKNYKQLLLIGIGGSDLGARALREIFHDKSDSLELFFLGDTTDPREIERVCSKIDFKKCAVNVVSKSGNTVEVLSVFLYIRERLVKALGKNKHASAIYAITEDNSGALKKLVDLNGYHFIEHPANIGGRWSVLSIVGLLSAAAAGISHSQLRKGGRELYEAYKRSVNNPAMTYAALHYMAMKNGQSNAVLMPYSAVLEKFGHWYRQLFGESLGKKNKGLTPIVCLGPKDQHSQMQLYNEGPFDKVVTFLKIEKDNLGFTVPKSWRGEEAVKYLEGWRLHEILNVEQDATARALAHHGRPNGTIAVPELNEYYTGQLFMFFELACIYLAELMRVNAFNQPGVEEGKKIMSRKLKRR